MIWKNLAFIALFLLGIFLVVTLWLRWYTHHGESLLLPDYRDFSIEDARNDAEKKSFELLVADSVFIVGKRGGLILDQNPKGDSKVKQNRKIYVTVTKKKADQIPVGRLPILYGKNYERKKKELMQGYEINTKIVGRKFDSGAPDHILEVVYDGKTVISSDFRKDDILVDKGGTLEMILSKSSGGSLDMPDLACIQYDEAAFYLQSLNLVIGEAMDDGTVRNRDVAYIWKQEPAPQQRVYTGDTVKIYLSQERPSFCDE